MQHGLVRIAANCFGFVTSKNRDGLNAGLECRRKIPAPINSKSQCKKSRFNLLDNGVGSKLDSRSEVTILPITQTVGFSQDSVGNFFAHELGGIKSVRVLFNPSASVAIMTV